MMIVGYDNDKRRKTLPSIEFSYFYRSHHDTNNDNDINRDFRKWCKSDI